MSVEPPPAQPPSAVPPPSGDEEFTLDPNDRLLAAVGYVVWFIALVVLLLPETKEKPLLKDHAVQALGFAVVGFLYFMVAAIFYLCVAIITFGILALFLWVIFFVPPVVGIYLGYLAYTQDGLTEIPVLTPFMAEQGWFETRPTSDV